MHAIRTRNIEMIGDSELRFREDPVRMLRAARFSVKLNMTIPESMHSIIQKLLSGKGEKTFVLLQHLGLCKILFPAFDSYLNDTKGKEYQFITKMLRNTDNRIESGKYITPAFLYAAILWYPMEERAQQLIFDTQISAFDAANIASAEVIHRQVQRIMIPKRFSIPVREIWSMQSRLQKRFGKRAYQLVTHPRFRAAYDFLLLRGEVEGGAPRPARRKKTRKPKT